MEEHKGRISGSDMLTATKRFFAERRDGDRVLFYYSGHGDAATSAKGDVDGILVASDGKVGGTPAVTASQLWSLAKKSKASQVLIVIDACRSGAFANPALRANANDPVKVGVLTASSRRAAAYLLGSQSEFTRLLFDAMTRRENWDHQVGGVSAWSAFASVLGVPSMREQRPDKYGDDLVLEMKVGQPPFTGSLVQVEKDRPRGPKITMSAITINKGVGVDGTKDSKGNVIVTIIADEDTERFEILAYQPGISTSETPLLTYLVPGNPTWKESDEVGPLVLKGFEPGTAAKVMVRPCNGNVCRDWATQPVR